MNDPVDIFIQRLIVRRDAYYRQLDGGRYEACYSPVTRRLVQQHLDGEITLGMPVLTAEGMSRELIFDSDVDEGELDVLENYLTVNHWHHIREGKREGRAGHCRLLFDKMLPAQQLRTLAEMIQSYASVRILEVFPKQDKPGKLGNAVKLPLGINRKLNAGGVRAWFEGAPRDVESQLLWFARQPLNPADVVQKLVDSWKPTPKPEHIHRQAYSGNRFDFLRYAMDCNFSLYGNWYQGPCPGCKSEGHDADGNHLGIHSSSGAVHCWRGCRCEHILRAIRTYQSIAL